MFNLKQYLSPAFKTKTVCMANSTIKPPKNSNGYRLKTVSMTNVSTDQELYKFCKEHDVF